METILILILGAVALAALVFAIYQTSRLEAANNAIRQYKRMIEETRQGKPPFLLNPGIEIVSHNPVPLLYALWATHAGNWFIPSPEYRAEMFKLQREQTKYPDFTISRRAHNESGEVEFKVDLRIENPTEGI